MSKDDSIMTPDEAALFLRIWPTVVRGHVAQGHLPARRLGKRSIILNRSDVLKFKEDREVRGLFIR